MHTDEAPRARALAAARGRAAAILLPPLLSFLVAVSGEAALVLPAYAAELRCAGRLVLAGDTVADVLEKCGPPVSRWKLDGRGGGAGRADGRASGAPPGREPTSERARKAKPGAPSRPGDREVWTYSASGQLARHLTFQKGRVAHIDVGGYGP